MRAERVGKYRIIALLGQGGMASVFLSVVAGPMGVNKLLVVKLLREELSQDEDFVAMFLNEARLATRLNHANVVQTYEVGVEGRHHFLAMDYLDGQPLHAVLRKAGRSGVPLDVHVRILAEMLAGLHYAHTLRALVRRERRGLPPGAPERAAPELPGCLLGGRRARRGRRAGGLRRHRPRGAALRRLSAAVGVLGIYDLARVEPRLDFKLLRSARRMEARFRW